MAKGAVTAQVSKSVSGGSNFRRVLGLPHSKIHLSLSKAPDRYSPSSTCATVRLARGRPDTPRVGPDNQIVSSLASLGGRLSRRRLPWAGASPHAVPPRMSQPPNPR
jgi:hypothetical protein